VFWTCHSLVDNHRVYPRSSHMDLTKEELKAACRRDKLYTTPNLNDKLYLHYKVSLCPYEYTILGHTTQR
jgi:hypothetical protein